MRGLPSRRTIKMCSRIDSEGVCMYSFNVASSSYVREAYVESLLASIFHKPSPPFPSWPGVFGVRLVRCPMCCAVKGAWLVSDVVSVCCWALFRAASAKRKREPPFGSCGCCCCRSCLLFLSADGLINNRFTSFAHVSIDANVIKACCFASSLARNPYIHGQLPQSCETHSYVRCAAGLEISRILFILGKAPDHHHHHRRIGRLAGTRRCWKISQIWRLAEHALFHSLGSYFLPSELFALYILEVFYPPFWQFLINVVFFFQPLLPKFSVRLLVCGSFSVEVEGRRQTANIKLARERKHCASGRVQTEW